MSGILIFSNRHLCAVLKKIIRMKIIIISNRKFRYIYEKLIELEKFITRDREPAPTVNNDHSGEVYIDGEKVCELLCISGRTLLRLCKANQINSKRVAHRCYYPLSDIENLLVSRSIAFDKVIRERLKEECKRIREQYIN